MNEKTVNEQIMNQQTIIRDDVLIEPDVLLHKLGSPNLKIFDATFLLNQNEGEPGALERYQEAHIPNAVFLDHLRLADPNSAYQFTVPSDEVLGKALGQLGINNDSEVVVYSTSMIAWATRIWWLLRYAGHENVRVLNGGLSIWQASGGEVEAGESSYQPSTFAVNAQAGWFVRKEDVLATLDDDQVTTINALPEAVYDQSHIAGSHCLPCSIFMDQGASLYPDSELKKSLGDVEMDKRVITYCGGGIAATVNAVVHKLVGNPNVAVYDGSMSEWTGEGLPVEAKG